jgi:L-lysine exporter family protein LysE/ArgO
MNTYLNGLLLGAGLIVAIGAQNAHLLRMGIMRQHVGLTVAVCILIDIVLICVGVAGVGALVQSSPLALAVARWGGAAFLLWYGLRSWRAVFASGGLQVAADAGQLTRRQALTSVLMLSLLNPHLYLDTVVLLGGVGGGFPAHERPLFACGAMTASIIWFVCLGYGATRLSAFFARPKAWKCIDVVTGVTMLALSATIAVGH